MTSTLAIENWLPSTLKYFKTCSPTIYDWYLQARNTDRPVTGFDLDEWDEWLVCFKRVVQRNRTIDHLQHDTPASPLMRAIAVMKDSQKKADGPATRAARTALNAYNEKRGNPWGMDSDQVKYADSLAIHTARCIQ
jgi:hypothetical protein